MTPDLTTTQLQVLKAAIAADPAFSGLPNGSDEADKIAKAFNAPAAPPFTVWKTNVSITKVGDNIVGTELAGLTSLNLTRLQTITQFSADGVNPSLADRRAFFDDVFSGAGGVNTRAKFLILWKRLAKRGEKLYATGTGSDAAPGTLVAEGDITPTDVQTARNLP